MGVKWGILGTGAIAHVFAEALHREDDAELMAVASRSPERAIEFASAFPDAQAFGSYEALVAAPDVDVVYIATPQHRHAQDALLVLDHRKNAVIEKPLVLDSASGEAIMEKSDRNALVAVEGMWTLFNPLVVQLIDLVDSGRLGALRMFSANAGPIGVPRGHRALNPQLGASVLWEALVYPISLLTALAPTFATPDGIDAVSLVRRAPMDEATAVMLRTSAGIAEFSGSFAVGSTGSAHSRARMIFENAWVDIAELWNPAALTIGWNDGEVEKHEAAAEAVGFGYEIRAVSRVIRGESTLPAHTRLERTLRNTRLIERIRDAATIIPWDAPR